MTGYLIRRLFQMVIVVFVSAVATYALLNFAPGGPLSGLRQMTQSTKFRITEEDIARIRAYYELDLKLPVRFSRWLIGHPRGRIVIGGTELFANTPVGCRKSIEAVVRLSNGDEETRTIGCSEYVYLRDLENRRSSKGILMGDFGLSWRLLRDRPVSDLILSRLPKTLQLMGISILISFLFGVPLGIYSAIKQYSRFDYFVTTLAFFGSSMPTFFFGLLLILLFSILPKGAGLPYLPPGSSEAVRDYIIPGLGNVEAGSTVDRFLHLILPSAVLAMAYVAGWSRFVRASMLDVLRQDYVRTARAKGLIERVVIIKHALRNALIPFITVAVFAIPALFGGAIITESIFSWPGMGRLYILALGDYDYPVAMALLLITAVLTVLATLLQDILYTMVDPRIRLS
ncbi:MAG: ABC transporter permease [Anaerolineales bacterium]|nr:ABC transporter permease [Anaerolineales bacterium]